MLQKFESYELAAKFTLPGSPALFSDEWYKMDLILASVVLFEKPVSWVTVAFLKEPSSLPRGERNNLLS